MPNSCCIRHSISKDFKLFEKASEQPSTFEAKDWVEINDDKRQNYDSDLIKTSILQSLLFDYTSTYVLVKVRVTAVGTGIVMCNLIKKIYSRI